MGHEPSRWGQGNYSIVQSRRVILHADGIVRRCGTEEGGCKLTLQVIARFCKVLKG